MNTYIAYFDEVKPDGEQQPCFWLPAIVVAAAEVRGIERQVSDLAEECFGTRVLSADTEFHVSALISRRDHFKEWTDTGKRIEVLKRLIGILDQHDRIAKVEIRLWPERMVANDIQAKAFMFLAERVDALVQARGGIGILIGDHEADHLAEEAAGRLSHYRQSGGTPYQFGRDIGSLIDTVHFTRSHLSRMLQLADVYAWVLQFCAQEMPDGSPQKEMQQFIRQHTRILQPHKYKDWPTEGSWLKPSR